MWQCIRVLPHRILWISVLAPHWRSSSTQSRWLFLTAKNSGVSLITVLTWTNSGLAASRICILKFIDKKCQNLDLAEDEKRKQEREGNYTWSADKFPFAAAKCTADKPNLFFWVIREPCAISRFMILDTQTYYLSSWEVIIMRPYMTKVSERFTHTWFAAYVAQMIPSCCIEEQYSLLHLFR